MEPADLEGALRERIASLAAAQLTSLAADLLPAPVRAVARFTPSKRARLAAPTLTAALATDPAFRQAVARAVREAHPLLADDDGDPVDRGALAWLTRGDGWQDVVATANAGLVSASAAAAATGDAATARRLTEQLEAVRATGRAEAERLRAELEQARTTIAALRRDVRTRGDLAARSRAAQQVAEDALAQERAALAPQLEQARARVDRAQQRAQQAEAALARATAGVRTAAREERTTADLRLRLLLETVVRATNGLRQELALPPLESRPADAVVAEYARTEVVATAPVRGRDADDPALLDALLAVPMTHLLVDGYNVTKSGYGEVSLEAQRARLLTGLGSLSARFGLEVTVVFDGVGRATPLAVAAPRGVRLIFSREGETADDVLVRLVDLEPPGRPVLVASDDREVDERVARVGGRAVRVAALLRLLGRA